MATPEPEVVARVAAILGWSPEGWRAVRGGYTPTARYTVSGAGGAAFVKLATTPITVGMLHREIAAYRRISGNFVPRLFGFDEADPPILVIEDLSDATWPPPWTTADVDRVLDAIEAMHATTADLPRGTLLDRREAGCEPRTLPVAWPRHARLAGPRPPDADRRRAVLQPRWRCPHPSGPAQRQPLPHRRRREIGRLGRGPSLRSAGRPRFLPAEPGL